VKAGADVVVVDGMQGGTAATQDVFIEHVGIPTLAACAGGRGAAGSRHAPQGAAHRLGRHPQRRRCGQGARLGADAVAIGQGVLVALGRKDGGVPHHRGLSIDPIRGVSCAAFTVPRLR
jgi:glutamate synthase domain-containing protein 2